MDDMGCILFVLFPLSFPGCHITDNVIFIFGRNEHASDDVLCVEAQVGIQHGIQLLGKIDGDHDEAERDDILHREEQAACEWRASSLLDALDGGYRTTKYMAEVGIQHGNQWKHKQDAEVDGRIESYIFVDRNTQLADQYLVGDFDYHAHKEQGSCREQEVLRVKLLEECPTAGTEYFLHTELQSSFLHDDHVEVQVVEQTDGEKKYGYKNEDVDTAWVAFGEHALSIVGKNALVGIAVLQREKLEFKFVVSKHMELLCRLPGIDGFQVFGPMQTD